MMSTRVLIAGLPRRRIDQIAVWLHDTVFVYLMAHDLAEAQRLVKTTDFRLAVIGPDASTLPFGEQTAVLTLNPYVTEKFLLGEIRAELTE